MELFVFTFQRPFKSISHIILFMVWICLYYKLSYSSANPFHIIIVASLLFFLKSLPFLSRSRIRKRAPSNIKLMISFPLIIYQITSETVLRGFNSLPLFQLSISHFILRWQRWRRQMKIRKRFVQTVRLLSFASWYSWFPELPVLSKYL